MGSVVFVGHIASKGAKKDNNNSNNGDTKQSTTATTTKTELTKDDMQALENGPETAAKGHGHSDGSVDWHLFRNIAYAWIVTVPVTALLSAAIMFILCVSTGV